MFTTEGDEPTRRSRVEEFDDREGSGGFSPSNAGSGHHYGSDHQRKTTWWWRTWTPPSRLRWLKRLFLVLILIGGIGIFPRARECLQWLTMKYTRVPAHTPGSFLASLDPRPLQETLFYTGKHRHDHYNITKHLWDQARPKPIVFRAHALFERTPLLSTHFDFWRKPTAIAKVLQSYVFPDVKTSSNQRMRNYKLDGPWVEWLVENKKWEMPHDVLQASALPFLRQLFNPIPGRHVEVFQPAGELYQFLPDMRDFIHSDSPVMLGRQYVSMSSGSTINPFAWESDDQIHIQLYGRKRFVLAASSNLDKIYPYPSIHPHDRQSKLNVLKSTKTIHTYFPDAKDIQEVWEVVLVPGDVLVIPANTLFWQQTLPEHPSLSAIWTSTSKDAIGALYVYNTIEWMVGGNQTDWPRARVEHTMATFIQMLIDQVIAEGDPHHNCYDRSSSCRDEHVKKMLVQEFKYITDPRASSHVCAVWHDDGLKEVLAPYVKVHVSQLLHVWRPEVRELYLWAAVTSYAYIAMPKEADRIPGFIHSCVCDSCGNGDWPSMDIPKHTPDDGDVFELD